MKASRGSVLSLVGLCVLISGCATLRHGKKPDYLAMSQVSDGIEFMEKIWEGKGRVVVGRLEMPRDAEVASRISTCDDGSYCTPLYPERRLVFYAHGYDPLEITRVSTVSTDVYDAGSRHFVKARANDMRQLQGQVTLSRSKKGDVPITCTLQIRNDDYLWEDCGHQCGAPIAVDAESKTLASTQPFIFENLSRIPYVLVVSAPGYIQQELEIDRGQTGVIDLGNVVLQKAKALRVSYISRVRQKGGEWIGDNRVKTARITCDGVAELAFSDQRDGLGNSLELRMNPRGKEVEASFFFYNDGFYSLGELGPEGIPAWDKVDVASRRGSPSIVLEDGHLYLFKIDDVNGTDIQLLFHVEKK